MQEITIHVLDVRALLLILLVIVGVTSSSVLQSRPYHAYSRLENTRDGDGVSPRSNNVHNITIDCGNPYALRKAVSQCSRDVRRLTSYGYPWFVHGNQKNPHNPNETHRNGILRDALDSLDHVCSVHDRRQTCLEEGGVEEYCLKTDKYGLSPRVLQFICHKRQRDENLVNSLQCILDKRVLVMLYFHIADRCSGMDILDDIMAQYKNAYFYTLNIDPGWVRPHLPLLYCVPKSVISTCIRGIVEDHCGIMAADFVQNYLAYIQDSFQQTLESAGLNPKICDNEITPDKAPGRSAIPPAHSKLTIFRLLESTAPGTALDTVYGKQVMALLQRLSGAELCATGSVGFAYQVCEMSSDDKSEKGKFSILQFAHHFIPLVYHGTQCSRLEQFIACWNLLQQTCGPNTRGFAQRATLLVEGCKIQTEMDTVGCKWQDMLLPHYINASRVTVWPTVEQCLQNPMFLENAHFSTLNNIVDDLETVISLLQPGVEDISKICGSQAADRLWALLNKLRYLQLDALKYLFLSQSKLFPN